jgi:hypothetical protein
MTTQQYAIKRTGDILRPVPQNLEAAGKAPLEDRTLETRPYVVLSLSTDFDATIGRQ